MSDVENQTTMRILGAIIAVASIIQIGVSGRAYTMTSWKVGAWWAGVLCFLSAICGMISTDRYAVLAGCAFSGISVILIIVGLILDGIIYGATNSLDTCFDQDSKKYNGDSKYYFFAGACSVDHSQTCLCVSSSDDDTCYVFDLEEAGNCGQILTQLPSLLLASVIFLAFLFAMVLAYSAFTCKAVCCNSAPRYGAAPGAPANNDAQVVAIAAPSRV